MLARRTLLIFAVLVLAYAALVLIAFMAGPEAGTLEEFALAVWIGTVLTAHLFHKLGVPGLLEHGGACGWFACAPSVLGWMFVAAFWGTVAWGVAWALARLTVGAGRRGTTR